MTATSPQIWVDGIPLTSLVSWGELVITDRWPYGNWEASWTIPTLGARRFAQLAIGKSVQVFYGASPRFAGYMSEPNWDTGEMVAFGSVRRAEDTLALSGGLTTSTPDAAIDAAITRGAINWIRRSSISAAAFVAGDETQALNTIGALLDAFTTQAGVGWGVNARREVFTAAAPTVPIFAVTPGSGSLGVSDDSLAATIFGRYDTGSGRATVSVGSGSPEVGVDLTELGVMDATRATQIIASIYGQTQAQVGWTNGLDLTADQVTNLGGAKVNLANLSAGAFGPRSMRLIGLRDPRGLSANTDILLAETTWNVDDGTVQCVPSGMAARDLTSIIEGAGGQQLAFTS